MNSPHFYKPVPQTLLARIIGRDPASGIDPILCGYEAFLRKFNIPRKGALHLGGHIGQELPMYAALGFRNVVMVEPLEDEFRKLDQRIAAFNESCRHIADFMSELQPSRACAVRCAVSDRSGTANFYRTRASSLSSLSKPKRENFSQMWQAFDATLPLHKRIMLRVMSRNAISYDEICVPCKTLDELVDQLPNNWRAEDFSYLRMNIQGSELKALLGGLSVLKHISLIDLETNIEQRYENAPSKDDFDALLEPYGFKAVFGYRVGPMGNLFYVRAV